MSDYGTVKAVQAPINWFGSGLDGFVKGVGKVGSFLVSLPLKPVEIMKRKGGEHGKETGKHQKTEENKTVR